MVIDGKTAVSAELRNDGTLRVGGKLAQDSYGSSAWGTPILNTGEFTISSGGAFSSSRRFENTGALTVNSGGSFSSRGQLYSRDAAVTIDVGGSLVSTFSQGQGENDPPGYYAYGGPTIVNGLLQADLIRIQQGGLSGSGTLRGRVEVDFIRPGNSPGALTIDGDLVAGALELELASASSFDRLVVSGSADIGSVWFVLLGDYQPVIGDSFQVLSVSGSLTNSFWRVSWPAGNTWADAGGYYGDADPSGLTTVVTFNNGLLSVTAVPEPANWMLWAGGIFAIAFRLSRHRAAT